MAVVQHQRQGTARRCKPSCKPQQQSVSGVSVDEEMVNIIQYQQIYEAAAKVVSTVASLMNTAISMAGPGGAA